MKQFQLEYSREDQALLNMIVLKGLEWDSRMLSMSCGIIDCSSISSTVHPNLLLYQIKEQLKQHKDCSFVTIKLSSGLSQLINQLVSESTHLIDTELVFQFARSVRQKSETRVHFVDHINPASLTPLADEMVNSRLFLDTRLPKGKVRNLWLESVRNHCTGRADQIAVAMIAGKPAGMATIHFNGPGLINLFIVGVLKPFQHRGIGTDLLLKIIEKYSDTHEISVETSSRNIAAQQLYQNCGFRCDGLRYILHKI